jgi:superfamily II DNA/RNA helicase
LTDTAPSPAPPVLKTFADAGVDERICAALADKGIINPFPIQELTLPLALTGADLIGQARTGTGKTLAFGIPLIQRAMADPGRPAALVIVPTRELCLQVRDDLAAAAARTEVNVIPVYGGKSIDVQVEALQDGANIVVGTPGRLLDLLRRGSLNLSGVTGLVLDEADEMLDLGFLPDVEQLIQATAAQRQTLLFSATMPSAVVGLARRYMDKPTFMRADVEEVRIGPDTQQHFFSCHRMDKPAVLARILQSPGRGLCVVFSRTKRMADVLVEELRGQGVNAAAIHSDLRQDARERALKSFRNGKTDVLVATEVAARGLDITDVTHVVNYDCPDDEKMYLHRIGRTGRAGAAGVAITLAVWNELARLEMIKKALGITDETHEVFSTSPILQELFDLPPDAKAAAAQARKAAAAEATALADDEGESGEEPGRPAAEPRRRSRGGRRGRGRSTDATRPASDDSVAAAAAAPAAKADDATAATSDAEKPGGSSRPAAQRDSGDSGTEGDVVRRVRTRRRDAGETPRPPAAPTPRTRSERAPASDEPSNDDDDAPRGKARQPRRNEERRNPRRAQQRGRDGRKPRQQRNGGPRTPDVDTEVARGKGRPRLARPLVIAYLP